MIRSTDRARDFRSLAVPTIVFLAIAASFNGIWNDFTYDDLGIVVWNELIHDLPRSWRLFVLPYWPLKLGGDGYRPLTLLGFALQWAAGPGSPALFHAVSIALYAACAASVFALASLLVPRRLAFFVTALFAVHPVHVEAVASIVGQSELWTMLILVLVTVWYIRCRRTGELPRRTIAGFAGAYLAACLFKEHGVVLPLLLLAAELTVIDDPSTAAARTRQLRPLFSAFLLVAVIYVGWRTLVIGRGLAGFAPFTPFAVLDVGVTDRVLTMIAVVPTWVRLLVWPATLTTEYGPPQFEIATGFALSQLPGFLILIGVVGLSFAARRRAPVVAFGLLWLIVSLLPSSNFIIPSGVLVAERTLFTPSVGFVIAVAGTIVAIGPVELPSAGRVGILVAGGGLLWLGIARSIAQTAVWRSNVALFDAAVQASPNAYRSHYMRGSWMMTRGDVAGGEVEYVRAIGMFPFDPGVMYNLGQHYFRAGQFGRAYLMFDKAERLSPKFFDVQARKALALAALGRFAEARPLANRAIEIGVGDTAAMRSVLNAAELDETSRAKMRARGAAPIFAR